VRDWNFGEIAGLAAGVAELRAAADGALHAQDPRVAGRAGPWKSGGGGCFAAHAPLYTQARLASADSAGDATCWLVDYAAGSLLELSVAGYSLRQRLDTDAGEVHVDRNEFAAMDIFRESNAPGSPR